MIIIYNLEAKFLWKVLECMSYFSKQFLFLNPEQLRVWIPLQQWIPCDF